MKKDAVPTRFNSNHFRDVIAIQTAPLDLSIKNKPAKRKLQGLTETHMPTSAIQTTPLDLSVKRSAKRKRPETHMSTFVNCPLQPSPIIVQKEVEAVKAKLDITKKQLDITKKK